MFGIPFLLERHKSKQMPNSAALFQENRGLKLKCPFPPEPDLT